MATILIVDDNAANREPLTSLLSRHGHRLLEADDGAQGLAQARAHHPDLVITDILMPNMDGYEFVCALRIGSKAPAVPVIFYSATYLVQEMRGLANLAGVNYMLTKPAEPLRVLEVVEQALGAVPVETHSQPPAEFDREQLRMLTAKLSDKAIELTVANERLNALLALAMRMAQYHDADDMLQDSCAQARKLVGAKIAAIGMASAGGERLERFFTSGTGAWNPVPFPETPDRTGMLERILRTGSAVRARDLAGAADLPTPVGATGHSFLGSPIASLNGRYGVLYFVDKVGLDEFTPQDEALGVMLGSQLGSTLENIRRYGQIREHAASLEHEIGQRKRAEQVIERQLSHLSTLREIDRTITGSLDLPLTLDIIMAHVARELAADAVDVLLMYPATAMLTLAASRGYRNLRSERGPIHLGEGIAGKVAFERRILEIEDIRADARIVDRSGLLASEGFITYAGAPLISKGRVLGVIEVFHRSSLDRDDEWMEFFEALAGEAAIAVDMSQLFEGLQRSNLELVRSYEITLEGWSRALDLRDNETEGHTLRVTELSPRLAAVLGMAAGELSLMRRGALLHDIGKMGLPDSVLLKPGPLSEAEWAVMKQHPTLAMELLSPIEYLRGSLDIPYYHHEKWDGSGYPHGLKGEQIPLAARIFAVVDVWDALRSDRPYRRAWPEEQVRAHIRLLSGTHFEPRIVEAFFDMLDTGIVK